jgi:VWFA-related protein
MSKPRSAGSLLLVLAALQAHWLAGQSNGQAAAVGSSNEAPYGVSVSVDEVVLNFHAVDGKGRPISDLKPGEFGILDNGRPPRRIVAFDSWGDSPLRIGILLDTSESMRANLARNRALAIQAAQTLLRRRPDEGFVMGFGRQSRLLQTRTSDASAVRAGVLQVGTGGPAKLPGTAIFDVILSACLYNFGGEPAQGRAILLFSDGEDNASYTELKDAVDTCQRGNTAIYAFRAGAGPEKDSTGPGTLAELAAETGGRVFRSDDSETGIENDLRTVEADLRNQYRVVYDPSDLKHDGSFHRVELTVPERVNSMLIRSGYYAPAH